MRSRGVVVLVLKEQRIQRAVNKVMERRFRWLFHLSATITRRWPSLIQLAGSNPGVAESVPSAFLAPLLALAPRTNEAIHNSGIANAHTRSDPRSTRDTGRLTYSRAFENTGHVSSFNYSKLLDRQEAFTQKRLVTMPNNVELPLLGNGLTKRKKEWAKRVQDT